MGLKMRKHGVRRFQRSLDVIGCPPEQRILWPTEFKFRFPKLKTEAQAVDTYKQLDKPTINKTMRK